MRLTHPMCILLSGAVWLGVGIMLLTKGLNLVVQAAHPDHFSAKAWIIPSLTSIAGGREQAALLIIATGLLLGFIKGRWVLVKSVQRTVTRILSQPSPLKFSQIYAKSYYFLILGMMGLGFILKLLPLAADFKGLIDVAIGSALMNGALLYFRCALVKPKT